MTGTQPNDPVLGRLRSEAQSELIDAVDRLRAEGFHHELPLPQLIVCGDQSSGKSSVLEAISRVHFPASGTLCTRFATELRLRSAPVECTPTVTVQSASYRKQEEARTLQEFKPATAFDSAESLRDVIEEFTKKLLQLESERRIFEDKLIVTISSPKLPNLTLVDLPGVFHASPDDKKLKASETANNLVASYMQNENSIILAVIAADNNFENQIVSTMARRFDNTGRRTLGIITKPDKVDLAGQLEHEGVQFAKNLKYPLELGWHVLKNRGESDKSLSPDERDSLEAQFFSQGSPLGWKTIPVEDRGADSLRVKLSDILLHSISRSLPSLAIEVRSKVSTHERSAETLGEPKTNESEKREELREISLHLNKLVDAGIEGNYLSSSFFNHADKHQQGIRRLRATLRNVTDDFTKHMYEKGKLYNVAKEPDLPTSSIGSAGDLFQTHERIDIAEGPKIVSMENLFVTIHEMIKEFRGCELNGLIPSAAIAKVFQAQSKKWDTIAKRYVDICSHAAENFLQEALKHSAPLHIAQSIVREIAHQRFEALKDKLEAKRAEMLQPYRLGYLITTGRLEPPTFEQNTSYQMALEVHRYVEAYYKVNIIPTKVSL